MYPLASSLLVTLISSPSHSSLLFFARMARTHAGKLCSFCLSSSVSSSSLISQIRSFTALCLISVVYCAR